MGIFYDLQNRSKGEANVQITNEKEYTFNYPCGSLYDCTPYVVILPAGHYTFETWGAQGGSYYNNNGGRGGYSVGSISLKASTVGFLHIGGKGTATNIQGKQSGGFNGGGYGQCDLSGTKGAGGGGATDIRLIRDTLYSRVIVSGGGGSGFGYVYNFNSKAHSSGGYGGGEKGEDTKVHPEESSFTGGGGNQTNPGYTPSYQSYVIPAKFGEGGSYTKNGGDSDSPGGGGGWFGGSSPGDSGLGAAGGSGYILTESSYKPPEYELTSEYYMKSISQLNGIREGNGMIRITINEIYEELKDKCKKYCTFSHICPNSISSLLIISLYPPRRR
ncbi:loricrin, putative [Trichomonas vaginalis G3]|uniref:receptor protein-tyrosine kinase n=1 Tax=Trichomonas vaginalis (strain ATCC PRA-98 / G3) TaxID=412133 RepID=A2FRW0_TRIV3|nr:glycine-rich protein family [Trichomonas vaginalis G3]EAX92365.1 loricrin, putative [Trichomonas vaginalis G3]KAI5514381.1 glycine-rich protein family [Trichomonas vaginalis G3]|eukprot:XP_001305295.1 loricrin [Trichomonas vaginalis G3]